MSLESGLNSWFQDGRVEMRIARLRAFTHKSPVHQTGLLCAFRTEYYNERLTRIRKLNRKIGENLKLLYGYRCQLCGQLIGEEFGAPIAEAHHIDYYVKSLNNDANNQMVVCPNHHSIIHEADPTFDRKKMMYLYPNGAEQRLVLNLHLR